ncbi:hypothetical protein [Methylobacterium sp. E-046]|uniref:hypothetical protein n=1 Tax=Methylobacterium sp. E-046 TaxID=2836576 RepID=UPI001FBB417F|nr:hypothetical protein [Methylobacterium sp. E-046]MCJ2099391.1 hypothetical protein [Methylobacterium sp. E-046]
MVEPGGPEIDPHRIAGIRTLAAGRRNGRDGMMCAMEAVAHLAGEPASDRPDCASPTLAAFVRTWSDGLPQDERDGLILPLLPLLVGTRGSEALERRRGGMVTDWLIRTHLPAWFHLAKLNVEADVLAGLPEIRAVSDLAALCDHLKRARTRAAIANLTLRQTGSFVRTAAWDAAHRAAWTAIQDQVEAAGGAILAALWDAANAAAYAAARASGKASLEPTRRILQDSARALIERLIAAGDGRPDVSAPHPRP